MNYLGILLQCELILGRLRTWQSMTDNRHYENIQRKYLSIILEERESTEF